MLDDLQPLVDRWRPNLIVHDAMEFAAPIAARLTGAVHITHSLGPLTPRARVDSISQKVERLWQRAGIAQPAFAGLYDNLYLDIYPPSMRPPDGEHVTRRLSLQPVPDAIPQPLPGHLPDLADRPLVYVTFGTEMPDDGPLRVVIQGMADLPVNVVTVGRQRDPATFAPTPANVVIEQFVPQGAVLPQTTAVISHGGSGTVLAALAAGLPQLCLPYFADQPINARAVAASGSGIALDTASLDPQLVRAAVERLLADHSYAQAASRISAEIAAMPDAAETARLLNQLVEAE